MAYYFREDYDESDYDPFDYYPDSFKPAVWNGNKKVVCSTTREDIKLVTNIKDALCNLPVSAANKGRNDERDFCIESSFNSENIRVTVEGIGDLKFPLDPETVEEMALLSSKAKFGKGSETLLDLNVRDTQMIPASKLKVDIDENSMSALMQEMSAGLNIDPSCTLIPHLHNMLIYGPQQFFKAHTDTEKVKNMIATLVVILPSFYKGGELVISRDHKYDHDAYRFTSSEDQNKIKCIAFYSDVYHRVDKVTEGFRVVLTYNIELRPPNKDSNICSLTETNSKLMACVAEYFNGSDRPKKLIYLLNYSYSENSLKWHLLKGTDRVQGHALYLVAKNVNLIPCLALVVDEEYFVNPYWGSQSKMMSTIKLRYLVGENSETLLVAPVFPLEFAYDREVCYTISASRLWSEFEYHGEGFNGNEASEREYRYHRACVVLCDPTLIATSTANEKMKSLTVEVIEAVCKLSESGSEVAESHEARNEVKQIEHDKITVEGTFSTSEIVVSVQNEGSLSYPIPETLVHKLIKMSEGNQRVQPYVILPDKVNLEIKQKVWSDLISNISYGLKVNPKCKLVPKLCMLQMYHDYQYMPSFKEFFGVDLKGDRGDRGDITLVVVLPGLTQVNLSLKYAGMSSSISEWDQLKCVKYIACYSDCDIVIDQGTCLYVMYNIELHSELDLHHEIDICIVDEPLSNAVRKYFSDDIQPKKLIYLLNHDYSRKKLRWHMLKGSDETEAYAFYAVAKKQNLVPYLAFTEVKEHWSEAFSTTVTETHVKLIFLVDENNLEIKPGSDQSHLVNIGEVCFTMKNEVQSKPFKREKVSRTENVHYYNRACVILFAK